MKRRKQVTCCLCEKQETWNTSGVCSSCTAYYEFGKRTADRFQPDSDLAAVKVDRQLLPPKAYLGRKKDERRKQYPEAWGMERALERAIAEALGATVDQRPVVGKSMPVGTIDALDNTRQHERTYYTVMLPANKVPALEIFQIIADALAAAYDNGRRDGENLLAKLANGEVTVRQYEEGKTNQ